MRDLIRRIIREEFEEKKSVKDKLRDLIDKFGLAAASKYVGGAKEVIKIAYDDDIKKYAEENRIKLVRITDDGMNMYIDDMVVELMGLPTATTFMSSDEKSLGNFVWKSGVGTYKFTARVRSFKSSVNHLKTWRVVGTSGSYGFGYSFINKKETLGKRARLQIFKQIIDKYNLQEYM